MARLESFVMTCSPHVWGRSDCSLAVADWAMAAGHADSAADLRCTYSTETQCRAVLASRGGLIATVGGCAQAIGLSPIQEPEFGCIAVIGSSHNEDRQWAAIWQGFRWLVKWGDERSAQWMPFMAKPLAMWRV